MKTTFYNDKLQNMTIVSRRGQILLTGMGETRNVYRKSDRKPEETLIGQLYKI
jgi:hypothetical protein